MGQDDKVNFKTDKHSQELIIVVENQNLFMAF